MLHSDITDKIINAFYKVYNVLGYVFLNFGKEAEFSRKIYTNNVK